MSDSTKELEQEVRFLQRANQGIRKSLEEISLLQETLKGIAASREIPHCLDQFVKILKSNFPYLGYVFFRLNMDTLEYIPYHFDRSNPGKLPARYDCNDSILTWILNEGQISTLPATGESSENPEGTLLLIPLTTQSRMLGVFAVEIDGDVTDSLTLHTRELLNLAANQAAITIENILLYEEMQDQIQASNNTKVFTTNILESLQNGIITFDMGKRITHINHNAAVMFGVTDMDPVGKLHRDVFTPAVAVIVNHLFEETLKEGFVMDHQIDFELHGGVIIPYAISTSLLRDQTNQLIGITYIARDMTATRELERLRTLDKLKNDFVSTVSHELRSPLATIRAYIDTLIHRVEADDLEARDMFLKTIEDEANRLTTLVENMLDIASIESGKIELKLRSMTLHEVLNSVGRLCQAQSQNHEVKVQIDEPLPPLMLDKDRITQVLFNLVNNAIKYSPDGGDVLIHVHEDAAAVRVDIRDHGLGIKPEDQKNLFQKFFRVDSQKTSDIGGTGLGLAIVKKLTELHGGKMDVKSVYGEGSTFSVILPIPG